MAWMRKSCNEGSHSRRTIWINNTRINRDRWPRKKNDPIRWRSQRGKKMVPHRNYFDRRKWENFCFWWTWWLTLARLCWRTWPRHDDLEHDTCKAWREKKPLWRRCTSQKPGLPSMRWLGTMRRCLFLFMTFTYWDLNLLAACKRKYFEENYEESDYNHQDIYHYTIMKFYRGKNLF